MKRSSLTALAAVSVMGIAVAGMWMRPQARNAEPPGPDTGSAVVKRIDFVRSVRLAGTVEAVEATTIAAPRLSGQNQNSLVIMRMIKAGTTVPVGPVAGAMLRTTGTIEIRNCALLLVMPARELLTVTE